MFALHHHPFAVDAHFEKSLVLGFAAPLETVRRLLPSQLEPDTFDARHGFLAVAVVDTKKLRPAGFPAWLGRDFLLIGYRIFARFRTANGKRLRGLYILRSETDRRSMVVPGNLFTQYRYERTPIWFEHTGPEISITNGAAGLSIHARLQDHESLPEGSVFPGMQEARRFAGPLPFTFSTTTRADEILIVEGSREHWKPLPVGVSAARVPYLESLIPDGLILSNAFLVEDIDYHWQKGRTEKWAGNEAGSRGPGM